MTPAAVVVVLGESGLATAESLARNLPAATIHAASGAGEAASATVRFADTAVHLRTLFRSGQPIVALMASGIVVRALAPLLADKWGEPPVVAVAEDGSVAVPLLGGHHGANALARSIAEITGGVAAITTAGDLRLGLALDEPPPGWTVRNPEAAKPITAALLRRRPVGLRVEAGEPAWLLDANAEFQEAGDLEVLATREDDPGSTTSLVLHPQVLAIGVGCERGTDPAELVELVQRTLAEHHLAPGAIACVVSLDIKADEPAILALAATLGAPARFFTADELETETPRLVNPSQVVFEAVGCHGVAEGAALAAVGLDGELIVPKVASERATCAIAEARLSIDPAGVGRARGRLAVVGIGPGDPAWRTTEAQALLAAAEDWVGYGGYLELLGAVPGTARLHPFPLGAEEARCQLALDLAARGRQVALVSSGDPGIYAMAALVVEMLERAEDPAWRRVDLVISPGISALQAAAARTGAPIGHDFCAISLSDLLTPRAEIERRLHAAAEGDFVVALYNPASFRRRELLPEALRILGDARPADTPVILARNLGRSGEGVSVHRLADFAPEQVDMLSVVIVGSSRTRLVPTRHGPPLVVTPRGYALQDDSG